MKLTDFQLRVLRLAATEQQSAIPFPFATVRKLLKLDLIEGIGTGEDFVFWATDAGREFLEDEQ